MKANWQLEWNSAQSAERTAFVLVAIASLLNILLGVLNYPIIGHDAYVHLNWLDQFTRISSQGPFYPRWLPDSFGGFGAPTFYFYPPLVYCLASGFHYIGVLSASALYQSVQLTFSFLTVITSFVLLRQQHGTHLRAITGSLLYSFLAYHFCDVYVRDALTEHAVLAFLPIVFLRFPNTLRSITILAIGWVGLFVTNLPVAYLAVISVGVVTVARRSFKELPLQGGSIILAITASAIYLFPAFALRGLVHQRHLFDLPMHTSQFGFAILDVFQGHFDWLRILSIATILSGFLLLLSHLKKEGAGGWSRNEWKWLLAAAIFFQIPFIGSPLWHFVPGMAFVQFSWRWNGILLLAIAVLYMRDGAGTAPLRCCILIGLALITLLSELTLSRNIFTRPALPINSFRADAPEYAPKWASNDPSEVIGIALRRMNDLPAVLLGLTMPDDSLSLISKNPTQWNFSVALRQAVPVRFHQFYWPYWKLYTDSTEIPTAPDPNGFATAELPAGHYSVVLKLEKSEIESTGFIISIVGFSILIVLLIFTGYRSIIKERDTTSPPDVTRRI